MTLAWTTRGSIQYTDVMNMSHKERAILSKISKANLEITAKSGLPFF